MCSKLSLVESRPKKADLWCLSQSGQYALGTVWLKCISAVNKGRDLGAGKRIREIT